jgi:hypothetical protein
MIYWLLACFDKHFLLLKLNEVHTEFWARDYLSISQKHLRKTFLKNLYIIIHIGLKSINRTFLFCFLAATAIA